MRDLVSRRRGLSTFIATCLFLAGAGQGRTQLPDFADQLPRIAPKSPAESMGTMKVSPGYRVNLIAAEPNVYDPVAVAFDESARMYVVEMCDYSEQETEQLGNIRLLEDKDGDGTYESSILFADTLSWPTAIACYDGGVFVGAAPHIWYLKDQDGDGKADRRDLVFTGFGRGNVQGLLNSFCWGLDNRLYGQTSSSGAVVTRPDKPEFKPVTLSGRDFSFDPAVLDVRPESGGGQHGMSFDDWGNRFTCHNSDHLQLHLYEDRYQRSDNILPLPPTRQSIAVDGPQASVYRISEVEPWRILRTNLRINKLVPGIVEGGGRPSGYFTSATGITIYRGDAMPELQGLAFVGDVGSNIIHRKRLTRDGVSMRGERMDQDVEFLAASDIWFRPVQFANAPDGSLVVLDLYREVIEHPKSLPQEIKKHLDLTSGRDKGRIYSLSTVSGAPRRSNDLSRLSVDQVVELLIHPNAWQRETAARIIAQKMSKNPDPSVIRSIERVARSTQSGAGRLQCLGVLAYLRQMPTDTSIWLSHEDPRVRRASVRLLEASASENPALRKEICKLAEDPDLAVRFQVGLTLSLMPILEDERIVRTAASKKLLQTAVGNTWVESAAANASRGLLEDIVRELVSDRAGEGRAGWSPDGEYLLGRVFVLQASQDQLVDVDRQLSQAQSKTLRSFIQGCIAGIASKSKFNLSAFDGLPTLKGVVVESIDSARAKLADATADAKAKIEAVQSLRWQRSEANAELLVKALDQREPGSVQASALDGISEYTDSEMAIRLLAKYSSLAPSLKTRATDLLFSKKPWLQALLRRAGEGGFDLRELDPARQNALQQNADPVIRETAAKLLGRSANESRAQVLAKYREALKTKGNPEVGKAHFAKVCASCHKYEGLGYELGPNLSTFKYRGAEAILENVLDPNREVNPQYVSYTILTTDERTITGMVESESATSITLIRGDNARDTIQRSEIEQMKSSKLSIMPEGIENQLDIQAMADLLAFLTGDAIVKK